MKFIRQPQLHQNIWSNFSKENEHILGIKQYDDIDMYSCVNYLMGVNEVTLYIFNPIKAAYMYLYFV